MCDFHSLRHVSGCNSFLHVQLCLFFLTVIYSFGEFLEMRIVTMHDEKLREQRNYLCPPDRRRPNPLRVCSDKKHDDFDDGDDDDDDGDDDDVS